MILSEFRTCNCHDLWPASSLSSLYFPYYALPLRVRGIKRWCASDVWHLSRTSGVTREQRGLGKLKLAQSHTWLGHHFQGQKVKGQSHQAALLTAVLARQAAAAVGVGTCWPRETAAKLPSVRRRKALRRPQGDEERGGSISWRPPAYSLFYRPLRHNFCICGL